MDQASATLIHGQAWKSSASKVARILFGIVLAAIGLVLAVGGAWLIEYLVIMAGGHHFMKTPQSDALVAYALPS